MIRVIDTGIFLENKNGIFDNLYPESIQKFRESTMQSCVNID